MLLPAHSRHILFIRYLIDHIEHMRIRNNGLDQPFTVEVCDQLTEGLDQIERDTPDERRLHRICRGYENGSDLFLRCQGYHRKNANRVAQAAVKRKLTEEKTFSNPIIGSDLLRG